jgi:hypothetical protein
MQHTTSLTTLEYVKQSRFELTVLDKQDVYPNHYYRACPLFACSPAPLWRELDLGSLALKFFFQFMRGNSRIAQTIFTL